MMVAPLLLACGAESPPGNRVRAENPEVVVYAIRHFEKELGLEDPDLTPVGAARAQALADYLVDGQVPLQAAYATATRRTRQTLEPAAAAMGLEIDTQWEGRQDLADHILATHDGEVVIAAGHSHTVPDLVASLGATEPELDAVGYGELWVVTVAEGEATAVRTPFD